MNSLVHVLLIVGIIILCVVVWRVSSRLGDIHAAINSRLMRVTADLEVAEARIEQLEKESLVK